MLRRPLRSSLKIPFPFRSDKLGWYRNPLRVIVPATVGIGGRIYVHWKHHWQSHNQDRIQDLVMRREPGTGLITFGNHQCFIDDSFVWSWDTRTHPVWSPAWTLDNPFIEPFGWYFVSQKRQISRTVFIWNGLNIVGSLDLLMFVFTSFLISQWNNVLLNGFSVQVKLYQ